MEATSITITQARPLKPRETSYDPRESRLRLMGLGADQLCDLHYVCLHILQAEDVARLAQFRGVQRVPCCALHRDVRLPAHTLFPLGLVADALSRCELAIP